MESIKRLSSERYKRSLSTAGVRSRAAAEVVRLTSVLCLEMANLLKGLQPVVAAFSGQIAAEFPKLGGLTSFSAVPPSKC